MSPRSFRRSGGAHALGALVAMVFVWPLLPPLWISSLPAPPGFAGMRVERDPETGGWRVPVASSEPGTIPGAQSLLTAEQLNRSAEGLSVVLLPDGSRMVDLQGRFKEYFVATRQPGGRLGFSCGPLPEAGDRFVPPVLAPLPVPASTPAPEK